MIKKVDNVSFSGKFHFNGYSKHTPKMQPYKEFYFMPELQTKNPVKNFFNQIMNGIRNLRGAKKLITDDSSAGMTFEA